MENKQKTCPILVELYTTQIYQNNNNARNLTLSIWSYDSGDC